MDIQDFLCKNNFYWLFFHRWISWKHNKFQIWKIKSLKYYYLSIYIFHVLKTHEYPPAQDPEDDPLCSRHSAAVKQVPFLYFWPEALKKLQIMNIINCPSIKLIKLTIFLRRRHFACASIISELDNAKDAEY